MSEEMKVPGHRTAKKRSSKTGSFSSELGKLISVYGQLADQAYQSYSPIVEDIVNSKSLNSGIRELILECPCSSMRRQSRERIKSRMLGRRLIGNIIIR